MTQPQEGSQWFSETQGLYFISIFLQLWPGIRDKAPYFLTLVDTISLSLQAFLIFQLLVTMPVSPWAVILILLTLLHPPKLLLWMQGPKETSA